MRTLKLLSYNAQIGIAMQGMHHYVLNSWQHVMPHIGRMQNLANIAELVKPYDIVALQEVDAGSFRSHYINQIRYLAEQGGFPHRAQQVTRNLGKFAQHAKGILSRYPLHQIERLSLPSRVSGRGALLARIGEGEQRILLINVHLSLSAKAQRRQLDFIESIITGHRYAIVMGDFNVTPEVLLTHPLLTTGALTLAYPHSFTHPSWKPTRCLDYVLLTPSLSCLSTETMQCDYSDHLPVSVTIQVPDHIVL